MKSTFFFWALTGAVAALCLFSPVMQAQEAPSKKQQPTLHGGFGYFAMSGERLNINGLNSSLSAGGYGHMRTNSASFGGGGYFVFRNILIGGGGAWLKTDETSNADNTVRIGGGYGFFNAGYMLHPGKRSVLYAVAGVGGGGYDISISNRNAPHNFQQQLNTPNGSVLAHTGGLLLNAQLSYQHFLHGSSGVFLGMQMGYKFTPTAWALTSNNTKLNNTPAINMNGFYTTLVLGFGGLEH